MGNVEGEGFQGISRCVGDDISFVIGSLIPSLFFSYFQ
jgi:hypothetical protein